MTDTTRYPLVTHPDDIDVLAALPAVVGGTVQFTAAHNEMSFYVIDLSAVDWLEYERRRFLGRANDDETEHVRFRFHTGRHTVDSEYVEADAIPADWQPQLVIEAWKMARGLG